MNETEKVTDEVKGLFNKSVHGQIQLFNRLSLFASGATKKLFAGDNRKPLPSVGEGLKRVVELNLACWSAAADHGFALVNDVADAYEKALGLTVHTPRSPSKSRRPGAKVRKPAVKAKP